MKKWFLKEWTTENGDRIAALNKLKKQTDALSKLSGEILFEKYCQDLSDTEEELIILEAVNMMQSASYKLKRVMQKWACYENFSALDDSGSIINTRKDGGDDE